MPVTNSVPGRAVLAIVRGDPDDTEVAALVAVLAMRSGTTGSAARGQPPRASRSGWSDRSRLVRDPLTPGPGAWRRSALPR